MKELLKEQQIPFFEEALSYRINQLKKQVELEHFEKKILDGNFSIRMSDIDVMSGYEFESFLRLLFEKKGYMVKQTSLSGDQGADLIISRVGEDAVVQAKRHSGKVSNSAIQEVTAAIKHCKSSMPGNVFRLFYLAYPSGASLWKVGGSGCPYQLFLLLK